MFTEAFNTLFSIRSLLRAVEQWKEPDTAHLMLFFNETDESNTRYVEINFYDEQRRIAPFISRRSPGQLVDKTDYEKFIWEPPYSKPKINIEPADLQKALINETPYSVTDPGDRLIELRNSILRELENMIRRREELMAVQAIWNLQSGNTKTAITITDESGAQIQDQIEFTRASDLAFSAATAWSDSANCKPLDDIRKACRLITKYTSRGQYVAVHGSTSADEFMNAAQLDKQLDNRRFELGIIRPERKVELGLQGLVYMGYVDGVEHFRYDGWYVDPADGVEKSLIPADKTLVAALGLRNVLHYGAIETLEGTYRARRWPKFYDAKDKDPEVYGIQLHSAPLPVTHQPNGFAIITT